MSMAISEERIDELIEMMLDNADDDGWCYIPEGLNEEEEIELGKRLTKVTMQDRIDTLMEGILTIFEYVTEIDEFSGEYDTMDRIKIKTGLTTIKNDSQTLLMDLHSSDTISDFFKIDVISTGTDKSEMEAEKSKVLMKGLADTEFKEQLEQIKEYCAKMIDMSDDLLEKMKL